MIYGIWVRLPRTAIAVVSACALLVPIGVLTHRQLQDPAAASLSAGSTAKIRYVEWGPTTFRLGLNQGTTLTPNGLQIAPTRNWGTQTVNGKVYEEGRWTSPMFYPGQDITTVIPSFKVDTPPGTFVKFYVRGATASGRVSSYDNLGSWTTRDQEFARQSQYPQSDDLATTAVDTFTANGSTKFRGFQIHVVLHKLIGNAASPTLTAMGAVAAQTPPKVPSVSKPYFINRQLNVPTYSQMIHKGEYPQYGGGGENWCSPTSLAMIMGYYGKLPSKSNYSWVETNYADPFVDHVARGTYDYAYQGTGNWPFNTAFANQYVDHGFVTRLTNLRDAEQFINAGIPLAATITFPRGGLDGAPISSTPGHVLVITGFDSKGNVRVNDPAAPANSSVKRTYNRAQFEKAWLSKGGVVYVVHDDKHPLPPAFGPNNAWLSGKAW